MLFSKYLRGYHFFKKKNDTNFLNGRIYEVRARAKLSLLRRSWIERGGHCERSAKRGASSSVVYGRNLSMRGPTRPDPTRPDPTPSRF